MTFVDVLAGTYLVGSPDGEVGNEGDDLYLHNVTLSRSFQVTTTEVTQDVFERVTGFNPSYTDDGHALCPECPVDQVTWSWAAEFTNMLSEETGLTPCYTCTGEGEGLNCEAAGSPYECDGYRLPTEAEWEIAARAGRATAFPNGGNLVAGTEYQLTGPVTLDNGDLLGSFAWYRNSSGDRTHAVGTLAANDMGLYDVIGNLCEWCHDWYGEYAGDEGDVADPFGPATGETRIVRGGSFNMGQPYLRLAHRNWYTPNNLWWVVGFRVAHTTTP